MHTPSSQIKLRRAFTAALSSLGIILTGSSLHATSDTWVGTTDGTWATSTNWSTSPATVPGTGDTATFNGAGNGNTTINLGGGVTLGTALFDTSSAAAYTIGSGAVGSQTLTLGTLTGGIQVNSTIAQNQLINANLALSTTGTYTVGLTNNSTTNTLTVAGGISASTSGTKTLTVTGAGNTAVSGNITNGTGTVALTKSGAGTLTLSGANTYTGGMTVSGGTLALSGTHTGGGTITVNAGATLSGTSSGTNTFGNFAVTGSSASATLTSGTYNVTASSGNTKIDNGGSLTVSGATLNVSGGGAFMPIGNTANTTSTVTLNSGAINVTNAFGVEVGRIGTGVLTINGGSFTVNETNATALGLILGDQSTAQGGTVDLNGGTLTVRKLSAGSGSGTNYAFNFNGGTLKASTTSNAGATFWASDAKVTANVRNGGGTIDNNGTNITIAHTLVHSTIGGDNATDGGLTFSGSGTTTLSGANTCTGATTVSAGTLATGATGTFGAGNVSVAASAALTFGNNASIADLSTLTFAKTSSAGSINLNFTGTETVGFVFDSVSSTYLNGGTYTATELNSLLASMGGNAVFTGTGSLSFSAIPEPATYAALAGALALGVVVIRRRRQTAVCS